MKYIITIISSIILFLIILRSMLFTSMFYHTPFETIFGLILALICIVLPMYKLANYSYWNVCMFGIKKKIEK